ncbi:hypothetical protein, conserved [Babesia ovata]|uniref:Uncharacterized protein n=1 Tax=Babesia ovata TaxID=189622 RepID=A0A2H6KFT9_9APIC|nr:uncharacterized protein BOVATA_033370 [Babesia ovata]GBE61844.1 hypothetical protein, conserved [Babesia ovata]
MAPIRSCVRRVPALIFCLYVIILHGLVVGAPPTDGNSESGASTAGGLAFYADNADFYRKVAVLESLSWPCKEFLLCLKLLLPDILLSNAPPEVKEADANECRQLILDVQSVSTAHGNYTELRKMLDEYRAITRGLQRKHITPERVAELKNALKDIEERFKGKQKAASDILTFNRLSYYRDTARSIRELFRKHKAQTPTSPDSHDQGSSADRGANAAELEPDLAGGAGGRHSGGGKITPDSDSGNETMRTLLNDNSLLTRLDKVQADAEKIDDILRDLTREARDIIPEDIQYHYDTYCEEFIRIRGAWDIYRHYNDITDKLKRIDPASPQASELIAEQRQLEIAFDEYAYVVNSLYLGELERNVSQILFRLKPVRGNRNQAQARHTVNAASARTPNTIETAPKTGALEPKGDTTTPMVDTQTATINTAEIAHQAESAPAPERTNTNGNTATSNPEQSKTEEPVPPSRTLESQAKAATPPQEVKPETETAKRSKTIRSGTKPNGVTSTSIAQLGKTEEAVSTPFTYPTEAKKSAPLQHPTKANDTTPPPQASKQQEPTPKLEPTSMQGTGGGKTAVGLDTSQTTEGNVGNIRDTKDSKMSSGHLIVGRTVIQIMVAVVLMAAL